VRNAADETFGQDGGIHDMIVFADKYAKDYVHQGNYRKKIDAYQATRTAPESQGGDTPGQAQTGPADGGISDYERAVRSIQGTAGERDLQFAKWTSEAQRKLQKYLAKNPPAPPGGAAGGAVSTILSRYPSREAILRSLGG
jgi:hypothetical protein